MNPYEASEIMKDALRDALPGVERDVLLAPYTTFRIGGPAKYFFAASTKEDIQKAQKTAQKLKVPFFVLGDGSNILISDKGFKGLVILLRNRTYKLLGTTLYAEAGVAFPQIVKATADRGLSGLEWAGGLPGTVGGAVRGNAGAFGGEVKDNIIEVIALDTKGNWRVVPRNQCQFSYRSSKFKKRGWIVSSVSFTLQKGDKKTVRSIAADHIQYRKERHPLEFPNAGSIFKNCDLKKFPKRLQKQFKDVVKIDPFPVVPTAYLIAEAGLKGYRVGKAEVSEKHPNYIINRGQATSKDILSLADKVKKVIQKKFCIYLEMEVQYIE